MIAIGGNQEWPPRSPDLTPLDFFLWGYIKSRVYETVPGSIQELQRRIQAEVVSLRRTRMVRTAVHSMRSRAETCVQLNGQQVEGRAGRI